MPETPIGDSVPVQAAKHIEIGQAHDPYDSNPPTSGPHYVEPAKAGVYASPLPDEQLVHNLEHGYVWISYNPDKTSADVVAKLATTVGAYTKTILTPRVSDDTSIALVSWGKILKLDSMDETKIDEFVQVNRFKSPEPNAA